mmetsp:Transcript_71060/g.134332  ORF Transcript_71060/g.134332 Transcript_71060/m.134332 type:complete len:862 (+) Transcript_71060:53-2638(+)
MRTIALVLTCLGSAGYARRVHRIGDGLEGDARDDWDVQQTWHESHSSAGSHKSELTEEVSELSPWQVLANCLMAYSQPAGGFHSGNALPGCGPGDFATMRQNRLATIPKEEQSQLPSVTAGLSELDLSKMRARPLIMSAAAPVRVRREDMTTKGRSPAEVAVGSNKAKWRRAVNEARSRGVSAVRVRHILVQSEELAGILVSQLREGADFEELARACSACPSSREKGGEIGWSGVEDEHLDEILPRDVRAAAIGMKPGDIRTLTSKLGVHVLQVIDIFQTLSFESVPRTKKLRKLGKVPRPLIQLLQSSRLPTLAHKADSTAQLITVDGTDGSSTDTGTGLILKEPGKAGGAITMQYSMDSMGCQMNTADAERMEGQLQALGFKKTENSEEAQVVVLNTCSIREHAQEKVYAYLGPHSKRKQLGEDLAIVVAGCVAQQEGEELMRRVPEIDMVMGPQYANRIGDLLEGVFNGNQIVATAPTHIMEDPTQPQRQSSVCAWVNVIYGCNERCTYCVVPTTRGSEQSRHRDSIRAEIEDLVAKGYKEVTLLGQNIDSWGSDLKPPQSFADLLRDVGSTPGLARMRFVTSHPRYMSKAVVEAVAETPALCEMFHIPFQSGDNDILQDMARGYTVKRFKEIVAQIRSIIPDAAITADAIVGFPGETEEQFQNTLKLMEEVKFDQLNTAAYSPRPHTPAALWDNQLDEKTKKDRLHRINDLARIHAEERRQRYLGRLEEVLVEKRNPKRPDQVKGRNRQGCPVFFDGDIDELKGKIVPVRIVQANTYSLVGELEENRFAGGAFVDDGEGEVIEYRPQPEDDVESAEHVPGVFDDKERVQGETDLTEGMSEQERARKWLADRGISAPQ